MAEDRKLFYGWWIVLVVGLLSFTLNATPFNIVLKQLMEQFHTGRGEVAIGQSISTITGGIAGIIAGRLLQRHRARIFIFWGSLICGVCWLLLSLSNNLWYFYALMFVAGSAIGFSGVVATFTLLSKWFIRQWGTALGITQMGGFIGSLVLSPLVGLIAQNAGWRATYLFAGALVLVINLPLMLFVAKDSAESKGLLPDGDQPLATADSDHVRSLKPTPAEPDGVAKSTGLLPFFKKPSLWLMCLSFAFIGVGYSVVVTHEVALLTDMKVAAPIAASALGFTLGIGAVGCLASGWLADKLSSRYVTILFIIIAIAGMLLLIGAEAMPRVWLAVALFGLGIGASGTLLPIITREIFGSASFSALFGVTNVIFVAGYAVGAPLAGFMFDATGSYHSVFVIVAVIYLVAILTTYLAFGVNPRPFMKPVRLKK